jgi:hypothetical protein
MAAAEAAKLQSVSDRQVGFGHAMSPTRLIVETPEVLGRLKSNSPIFAYKLQEDGSAR